MRKLLTALSAAALLTASASAAMAQAPQAAPSKVTWDAQSLMIDGKREFIWSGEFHPFRLPDTNAWRDVYRKMKASGFNSVALYFNWSYHSPAPGVYDFTGIRDMDLAIWMAQEEGLYVIVRPGPYVNAELSRGGFPGYLARQTGVARTTAPDYLKEADAWLTAINAIIAKHQITRGGKVILYQVENELFDTSDEHRRYMDHLIKKARADGIDVPLFHNSPNSLPNWVPQGSGTYYTVAAPGLDLYAFDGYPGGSCTDGQVGAHSPTPNNGIYSTTQPQVGSLASPKTPGFAAEYGAGWFDYWGSVGNYACNAKRLGPGYVRTFYGANIVNRITIHNIYMAFGGTSWGWLPASVVYTSYDYGAPFTEDRRLRDKAYTLKQLGQFTQAAEPLLTNMDKAEPLYPTSDKVKLYHNAGPAGHLVFAIHDPHDGMGDDAFRFRLETKAGSYLIPQVGTMRLKGQDAKLLLADYALERHRLVYSTSELQTHLRQGERDIALLYGRAGETGETVLRFGSRPKVEVLEGQVETSWDAKARDLRLNYTHQGLIRVRITGGGGSPLLLLIGDEAAAQGFWRQETDKGPVLQRSGAVISNAAWSGEALNLTGEAMKAETVEVWGPAKSVTFNGQALSARTTPSGSLLTSGVPAPKPVTLPDLMQAQWSMRRDSPEADPAFDDTRWRAADLKVSAATTATQPPPGQPVLAMSDYGFHQGDVWYRGRFEAKTAQKKLELTYGGGAVGLAQVWIDGKFVGQHELAGGFTYPKIPTVGVARFDVDVTPGAHQISVMVRNMSHNWNLFANEEHKEGRGLISASLSEDETRRFSTPISWKLLGQGEVMDAERGPLNIGGLYGERSGWYRADAPDAGWTPASVTVAPPAPGTYWLRTTARLDLPQGQDARLGIAFGDVTKAKSDRQTRVLIFVNGWHVGNYVSHVGPQNTFVIPTAFLNRNGDNVIALAVTTDGKAANALESVRLVETDGLGTAD